MNAFEGLQILQTLGDLQVARAPADVDYLHLLHLMHLFAHLSRSDLTLYAVSHKSMRGTSKPTSERILRLSCLSAQYLEAGIAS